MNKVVTSIPASTMKVLCRYPWPGNVRELANFIERSVILSHGSILDAPLGELKRAPAEHMGSGKLEDVEREHIRQTLAECNWVIAGSSGAAARLGMKRTSLQYRMQKLGITRPPR